MPMHTHDASATLIRRELHRHGLAQDAFRASVAQAAGLHHADVHALGHLSMAHSLTPTQLAARMRLTSGGTTALIERLKRRGYLVEKPNPLDARSRILTAIPDRAADLAEQYAALGAHLRSRSWAGSEPPRG